jgi:hypothetical protein
MESRTGASGNKSAPPAPSEGFFGGNKLDPTPPPDHDDYVEARANGLSATRERRERRRRKK